VWLSFSGIATDLESALSQKNYYGLSSARYFSLKPIQHISEFLKVNVIVIFTAITSSNFQFLFFQVYSGGSVVITNSTHTLLTNVTSLNFGGAYYKFTYPVGADVLFAPSGSATDAVVAILEVGNGAVMAFDTSIFEDFYFYSQDNRKFSTNVVVWTQNFGKLSGFCGQSR